MFPYQLTLKQLDGTSIGLSEFKGKTLLIVNTASQCGFTPQYKGLQKLYLDYVSKGLVVMGFPCNDFGKQEPGSEVEIQSFVNQKFGVTFPMFEKVSVKGKDMHPLFKYLTQESSADLLGDISWNFSKFLVSPTGQVLKRFDSSVEPTDPNLVSWIEKNLPR